VGSGMGSANSLEPGQCVNIVPPSFLSLSTRRRVGLRHYAESDNPFKGSSCGEKHSSDMRLGQIGIQHRRKTGQTPGLQKNITVYTIQMPEGKE